MKNCQELFAALLEGKQVLHKPSQIVYSIHDGILLKYPTHKHDTDEGDAAPHLPSLDETAKSWEIFTPPVVLTKEQVEAVLRKNFSAAGGISIHAALSELGFK